MCRLGGGEQVYQAQTSHGNADGYGLPWAGFEGGLSPAG